MGQYTCKLVSSCIMFFLAFSALMAAFVTRTWATASRSGTSLPVALYGFSYSSYQTTKLKFSEAMLGTFFASMGMCGVCCLLSFIMMIADLCCKVTQCMTVIPKITMTAALLSGLLVESTCILFLVDVYGVDEGYFKIKYTYDYYYFSNSYYTHTFEVLPGYSFYIAAVTGIWLMISGCINFCARHATRVGVDDQAELVRSVAGQQGPVPAGGVNPYPNPMMVGGYFPPLTAMGGQGFQGYPSPSMGYFPPQTGIPGARLVLTNTSTQTSLVDIKKVVKTEEAVKGVKA